MGRLTTRAARLRSLCDHLTALLESEWRKGEERLGALREGLRVVREDSGDRRLHHLEHELRDLEERWRELRDLARRDFLTAMDGEAAEIARPLGAEALLLTALLASETEPERFPQHFLDAVLEATGGERGFLILYLPESSEAEVMAAREFMTRNLSAEEYDFSRTLLRKVLEKGELLRIDDASANPTYSQETTVRRFGLKSVLAVPMRAEERVVGAVYLEHNRLACAFGEEDERFLDLGARLLVFCLRKARLLPSLVVGAERVFLDASRAVDEIVGEDPKIHELRSLILRLADSPAAVLLTGESGTGKELVARALHYQGRRRDRPFVAISCAAIPDNLLESELFGHEKGAFTGATERYLGRLEQGNGGTVFLDEVSELAYPLQAKLLRFLQSNEFDRLGGTRPVRVDVRIVAATSKDLKTLVENGKFQEALYFRLAVVPLSLPALREHRGDIPLLVDHFLRKIGALYGRRLEVEPEIYARLCDHDFPGNARELENLIHRMVALATEDTLGLADLPPEIRGAAGPRVGLEKDPLARLRRARLDDGEDLRRWRAQARRLLAAAERRLLAQAIEDAGGNLTAAAKRLGIHRVTLHKILRGPSS